MSEPIFVADGTQVTGTFSAAPPSWHSGGADCHRAPAPCYSPGQRVWLSSKDLPLQVESRKLAPRFVGPFEVEQIINPAAVRFMLLPSMKVQKILDVRR